jgi:serine/threonine protein kinase
MALTSGTRLGSYEILMPLGAGGMGEVYRAQDTRLRRTVAIKILPDEIASHAERRARILAEARAAAALNHPGITTIYEVGEEGDQIFIVMELVSGKTCSSPIRCARHEEAFFLLSASSSVWDCRLIRRPAKDARRKREPYLGRVTSENDS